jgi:HEPN domain-containing protein
MSRLCLSNGDDHPEAAQKHLVDAQVLLAQKRADGAAYLSGYVVESALKCLYLVEIGEALKGHNFECLVRVVNAVATVAGAKTARYFGPSTSGVLGSAIGSWTPEMRYRPPSMTHGEAQAWYACAQEVFQETVHAMKMDGVI